MITQLKHHRASLAALVLALATVPALAQSPVRQAGAAEGAEAAYKDIQDTLGVVPSFFKAFPQAGIAGAWAEFKAVQLNPRTALSGKEKELIGLAVSAQIPCRYCVYFHTRAAKLNGATEEEIREAIAMAAITRHWSTVLNGVNTDEAQFQKEVDQVMSMAAERMKPGATGSVR